ncbi:hypothetical protein [Celerinatantimonas yamalensis]|uniref:Uncharacterized protein n=1 Tax=Celerinatantimonas yamalensis TaxID=559956 RepID=A0ABW9G938_9GAMM
MGAQLLGGWSVFRSLDSEDKEVFTKAMKGFTGVDYSPIAVATQVVEGTNFAFFCNAKGVYPEATVFPAIIHIYRNLQNEVGITHIQRLNY